MNWAGEAERCAEMRRILTNILGFSEMLADPLLHITPKLRLEYAEIIFESGQLLTEKIDEIMKSAGHQH